MRKGDATRARILDETARQAALKGFGAPARLVLLPKESHGYAAKESVLHLLWEQDQWLERYVKNKGQATGASPAAAR